MRMNTLTRTATDLFRLALLAMLLLSGCNGEGQAPPDRPDPCSDEWNHYVESILSSGDGMGHGPDIGSDEWKSVIEFKLGVRGKAEVPDRSSEAWCNYIDERLPQEGTRAPS